MGQSRERVGRSGDLRYTAYYTDITGRRRSAGTFRTERQANKAWQNAEAKAAEGRVTDLRRGRQQFRRYVEEVWFPNHQLELTSRQNYSYCLNKHILPKIGGYRLNEILVPALPHARVGPEGDNRGQGQFETAVEEHHFGPRVTGSRVRRVRCERQHLFLADLSVRVGLKRQPAARTGLSGGAGEKARRFGTVRHPQVPLAVVDGGAGSANQLAHRLHS
jgi:hypothetical protein